MKLLAGRAGAHTWDTVQPFNGRTTPLRDLGGNFTRLWTVETRGMILDQSRWGSNSPGLVRVGAVPWRTDGSLNGGYYRRLEQVVRRAERQDIVTGVVLFDHAFQGFFPGGWERHALNGLGPDSPDEVHTRGPWNTYQQAHVRRAAETLAPYSNVVAEVGNELHRNSIHWFQSAVVRWWRRFSSQPIGVSYASGVKRSAGRSQDWIARTGADWAAPGGGERVAGFRGAYVFDTDHAHPLRHVPGSLPAAHSRGDAIWLMDGLQGRILRNQSDLSQDRAFIHSIT